MDLGYAGRVVLVVGGTGLIGRALVARLRDEGAVAIPASRSAGAAGDDGVTIDTGDEASIDAALATVLARHGRLDAVVVTAAPPLGTLGPDAATPAGALTAIDLKALGFVRVAQAALTILTKAGFGRIVAVGGQAGLTTGNLTGGLRNIALITAAQHLAHAAAGTGVTVNVVNPGTVSADASTKAPGRGESGESTPEQVADLIAFLAAPISGAISGESIAVGHRVVGIIAL